MTKTNGINANDARDPRTIDDDQLEAINGGATSEEGTANDGEATPENDTPYFHRNPKAIRTMRLGPLTVRMPLRTRRG